MVTAQTPSTSVAEGIQRRPRMTVVVFVGALLVAGWIGYSIGVERPRVERMIGEAHVGSQVVSIQVGNVWYGAKGVVSWYDESGVFHDYGWPSCFAPGLEADVEFGAEQVELPDGGRIAKVAWIDCRSL